MYIQNDERWKSIEMAKNITIGEYGCLLTSICNILTTLKYLFTPETLCEKLKDCNGFDSNGNIQWDIVNKLFKLKENKYYPKDEIKLSNDSNINYLVMLEYKNTGHFCNIMGYSNNIIRYFDYLIHG